MFCHSKATGFGAKDTQHQFGILRNAFLSGSICGGSAPLVSLPMSASLLKTAGYTTEQDITSGIQAPSRCLGSVMTRQRREALLLLLGNYREAEGEL